LYMVHERIKWLILVLAVLVGEWVHTRSIFYNFWCTHLKFGGALEVSIVISLLVFDHNFFVHSLYSPCNSKNQLIAAIITYKHNVTFGCMQIRLIT
jgi:hypothetical protein